MFLTIFTPTFNREDKLTDLFNSLIDQSNSEFEWIVIDDGSTDGTRALFNNFNERNPKFNIRYIYQNNAGKHVAVNNGIDIAKGELFLIVDSDDYLPKDAVETIFNLFDNIYNDKKFAGISCKKATTQGDIGESFADASYLDITNLERSKYALYGDRAEVYKTEVLKKNKFPVFEGEKFITEAVVWDKIAYDGLMLRFYNNVIYKCNYQVDGLSNNIENVFLNNWEGYKYYVNQQMIYRGSYLRKMNLLFHCCRLAKIKGVSASKLMREIDNVNRFAFFIGYVLSDPYCFLISINEKRKFNKLLNK